LASYEVSTDMAVRSSVAQFARSHSNSCHFIIFLNRRTRGPIKGAHHPQGDLRLGNGEEGFSMLCTPFLSFTDFTPLETILGRVLEAEIRV